MKKQEYYVHQNDNKEGPYSRPQLLQLLEKGLISNVTLVWTEGMPDWSPLHTIALAQDSSQPSADPTPEETDYDSHRGTTQSEQPERTRPYGVGGWLLLFCVALGVIGPLATFSSIVNGWDGAGEAIRLYPSFKTAILWENLVTIVIALGGIYTCIQLWNEKPGADKFAQKYMIGRISLFLVANFISLIILADLPSSIVDTVIMGAFSSGFREIVFFGIWFTYLRKSKRVRHTYNVSLS